MEIALENGAEDVRRDGDKFELLCDPDAYSTVAEALEQAEVPVASKEVTRIPNNTVDLDADSARKVLKLLEALDDHDDVQNVSANFNVSDEVMAEIEAE
jgi:transcriptional/translational regulatory protein YebC/TACO1